MILEDDYNILEADSGAQCLKIIDETLPDIVLLDVNMPRMTGYEVCTKICQYSHSSNLPVIFVSALDSPQERLEGYEAGGYEYATKPINEEDLTEKISLHITKRRELSSAK